MQLFDIKKIINNISESVDKETALKNENTFYSLLLFISIISGTIADFLVQYVYLKETFEVVIKGSLVLLLFAFMVIVISFFKNEILKMYLYAIEVSLLFLFVYYKFFQVIGPGVILAGLLQLIIMLIYSRIEILVIYYLTFLFVILIFNKTIYEFTNWKGYFASKIIIITMIFIATAFIYMLYKSRKNKIQIQYNEILLAKEKLYSTLRAVGDGVISVDKIGFIDYMNPIAEKLTGWNYEDTKDIKFEEIFKLYNEKTNEKIESPVNMVLISKDIRKLSDHILLKCSDGSEKSIEIIASPIRGEYEKIVGVVLVFRDVSERKERRKQIENLSYRDHLTGLYNRRYFEKSLKLIDLVDNLPISFVFADVNGLKTINDVFGHEVGDELIKIVANNIRYSCRNEDIVSRIGGDEFVIILPQTDKEMAETIVSRIIERLSNEKIMNIDISVSFGIGVKKLEEDISMDILSQAEESMYQKKIDERSNKRSAVIRSIYNMFIKSSNYELEHSQNVSKICETMGKILKLNEEAIRNLRIAGELHDIGKIAMDKSILLKTEKLTDLEWNVIMQHPEVGYKLLSTSSEYQIASDFVRFHHEKWDGTGYPYNLKGEEIPMGSRIISIADAYDLMTLEKPYGKGLSLHEAIIELKKFSGIQFDPELVQIFIDEYLNN